MVGGLTIYIYIYIYINMYIYRTPHKTYLSVIFDGIYDVFEYFW